LLSGGLGAGKIADSIRRGLKEAGAYAEARADESCYRILVPNPTWIQSGPLAHEPT